LRTDRYSDFGTHTSPKLALRWQPQKWLLLRASAGTGFRAPSLPELYSAQTSAALPLQLKDPKRCPVTQLDTDCFPEFSVLTGGNPALQPERSRQASIGLVFEPIDGALVGIDWWRLSLRNTIGSLSEDVILSGDDRFEGRNIVRGPVDPAFPNLPGPITQLIEINENVGRQTAAGIDVDLRYRLAAGAAGRFTLQLSGSYLAEQRAFNGAIDQQLAGRYPGGPRWQHALTLGWERAGWNATVVQTWRGGYVDAFPGADGAERRVAAYNLWDAQLGYRGMAGWTLTAGVKNLFDRDPPFSNQDGSFQQGYDPSYADPRGRVWYARAGYRWR
jgi:iron complex outermembrane recepter protein